MRRRSSTELFNLSRRRSSLDIVTEKEVALFSQRKASTSSMGQEVILQTIHQVDEAPSPKVSVAFSEAESQECSLTKEGNTNISGQASAARDPCADAFDNKAFIDDEEHPTVQHITASSTPPLRRAQSDTGESRLSRSGAKYYNRKVRTTSDGDTLLPHAVTSPDLGRGMLSPDRTRKYTYDIAMGVISMDSWSSMIEEHESKKQKKPHKEKKEKSNKYHGTNTFLVVYPVVLLIFQVFYLLINGKLSPAPASLHQRLSHSRNSASEAGHSHVKSLLMSQPFNLFSVPCLSRILHQDSFTDIILYYDNV